MKDLTFDEVKVYVGAERTYKIIKTLFLDNHAIFNLVDLLGDIEKAIKEGDSFKMEENILKDRLEKVFRSLCLIEDHLVLNFNKPDYFEIFNFILKLVLNWSRLLVEETFILTQIFNFTNKFEDIVILEDKIRKIDNIMDANYSLRDTIGIVSRTLERLIMLENHNPGLLDVSKTYLDAFNESMAERKTGTKNYSVEEQNKYVNKTEEKIIEAGKHCKCDDPHCKGC